MLFWLSGGSSFLSLVVFEISVNLTCVCVCTRALCVIEYAYGNQRTSAVCLNLFPPYFLRQGLSFSLQLAKSSRLAVQQDPRTCLSLLLQRFPGTALEFPCLYKHFIDKPSPNPFTNFIIPLTFLSRFHFALISEWSRPLCMILGLQLRIISSKNPERRCCFHAGEQLCPWPHLPASPQRPHWACSIGRARQLS